MSDRRGQCVDCAELAPETETNFTLISAQHAWRCTKAKDASGATILEWRCPRCWNARKSGTHPVPRTDTGHSFFARAIKSLRKA